MPGQFRAAYDARLRDGDLLADPAQARAVAALERLETDLAEARPAGLFRKAEPVRGVYLWGPVGRGKSALVDLFFESSPVEKKRRTHFHVFMAEVHALVNAWRNGDAAARQARFGSSRGDDPIAPTAEAVARGARLLCFDEFQVTDIADAMILGRLFEQLFARGVTVAATSNRAPDDLYKDGLNRQLFLPFIELLKARMEVVRVDGPRDYRLDRLRAAGVWFSPGDPDNEAAFDALWREMLGADEESGATIEVYGRREHWPRAAGKLLRANFQNLCGEALGPGDYLAIAERFDTLFLEAVPKLRPEDRSAARRLATLIDALYEARTRLVVLAATEPARLYPEGEGSFEFERAASRLEEMRSAAWLEATGET
ncbi:MAG TPA: cell division protein ZapE [Caulobacteraceae bacterium]|nr:cell division protein ZapE [Caulobacteraceae bacterium]